MAEEGLVIGMDFDTAKAEAKARKLNREMENSKIKAENIKKEIDELNSSLEKSEARMIELNGEYKRAEQTLRDYRQGNISLNEKELQALNTKISKTLAALEKEEANNKKITQQIAKSNVQLDKQNVKTANIGDQILLNNKKQNKFTQAFEKSQKSADRFGKRLKSLIASALFFSVVTKAFTALRNEFGKLINETGTKTAKLVAQLKGNLATIGQTLYQSAKPYIEWLLKKLVQLTQLLAEGLAKALGKDVKEMAKLTDKTQEVANEAKKATAGFDTLQKIDTSTESKSSVTADTSLLKVGDDGFNDDLEKTKELLEQIIPLAITLGGLFAAWKITSLLGQMGVLSGNTTKIIDGVLLIAAGFAMVFSAAINWNEGLHNGENTLQAIIGTLGTILGIIGLIIAGVTAWPVLLVGAFTIAGMWIDNFKDKIDKWIAELPAGIDNLVNIFVTAAYGVWDLIKNLFKGIYEIFTGDWEKGLKRIGIALVNALVDTLNIVIDALNVFLLPIRRLITGAGKLFGKDWNLKDIAIPKIPRIPQLATGAILPGGSPMLAWVNDQPKGQPYLEGSIDNIAAAFEKYLGGNSGKQNININFTGTLSQLARVLAPEIITENNRASIYAR